MTGLQYGINSGIGQFFANRLVTGFDGDTDGITLGIEKLLSFLIMKIFRVM